MKPKFNLRAAVAGAFLLIAAPTFAYDFAVGGVCYNILDDSLHTVSVAMPEDNGEEGGIINYKGDIVVPATVTNGGVSYTVCGITESAFDNADAVTSVTLPEGLLSIGNRAFYGCGIKAFRLPASVTEIGDKAFSGCEKLQNFDVAAGNSAFRSVDGILFSADGTTLVAYPAAREGAYSVPVGVKAIGDGAFVQCGSLPSITIPEGVTGIGTEAFLGDKKLKEITLPASLTNIGSDAFSMTKWEENQPEGVLYLGKVAYKYIGKTKDANLTLREGTLSVAAKAFSGNEVLQSVTIPAGCTDIGDWAFSDCPQLATVNFPQNDVHIGWSSFNNTPYFDAHPDGMVVIGKTACGIKGEIGDSATITVPEGVEILAPGALDNADILANLILPKTVTTIESNALTGAGSLISLRLNSVNPPQAQPDMAGDDFYDNVTLIVPAGSEQAYKEHPVWKRFAKMQAE